MPKTSKTRLFFQQLQLRLSRLSFRTGLWVLAGCALSYLLAFAPILLPLSLSTKGVLWFIFFGLAKTLQYTALAIIGKEGIQRIRLWWRERKTKLSQKKWAEARKSLGVFQDNVGDFTTNLRLFCNPLGEVPHTSPYILSPPRSLLFHPPFLALFLPSSRARIQQFCTFCFHNLHKILHNSLLNSVLHMY